MTNYRLNEEKMFADVSDGMAIIINSETGVYYGMNQLGTQIFENFVNGVSEEQILEKLEEKTSNAKDNLKKFISFMIANEIMLPAAVAAGSAEAFIDETLLQGNEFIPTVEEYLDAQELLLADPIHEVREDAGWSPMKTSLNNDLADVARREAKMGV